MSGHLYWAERAISGPASFEKVNEGLVIGPGPIENSKAPGNSPNAFHSNRKHSTGRMLSDKVIKEENIG